MKSAHQYDPAAAGHWSGAKEAPPPLPPLHVRPALESPVLCPSFASFGSCSKGAHCSMAHGRREAEDFKRGQGLEPETRYVLAVRRDAVVAPSLHAHHPPNYKTQLCRHFLYEGSCAHGSQCHFAHGAHELRSSSSAAAPATAAVSPPPPPPRPAAHAPAAGPGSRYYKTRLCRAFEEHGRCPNGSSCNYAHGAHELQQAASAVPVVCTFWEEGYCKYGARCRFRHSYQGGDSQPGGSRQAPLTAAEAEEIADLLLGTGLGGEEASCSGKAGSGGGSVGHGYYGSPGAGPSSSGGGGYGDVYAYGSGYATAASSSSVGAGPSKAASYQPAAYPQQQQQQPGAGKGAAAPPLPVLPAAGAAPRSPAPGGAPGAVAGSGGGSGVAGSGSSGTNEEGLQISEEDEEVLRRRFNSLCCPITHAPFRQPVVAADGHVYERDAIETWLYKEANNTSPLTGAPLPHKLLIPCVAMRRCMHEVLDHIKSVRRTAL